jgi:hypothetical protein
VIQEKINYPGKRQTHIKTDAVGWILVDLSGSLKINLIDAKR